VSGLLSISFPSSLLISAQFVISPITDQFTVAIRVIVELAPLVIFNGVVNVAIVPLTDQLLSFTVNHDGI